MPRYKIVFIDIDGTLYDSKFTASAFTTDTIKKLTAIGVIVVLASGRNAYQVREISKQVGASNYIIASNGAEVFNYETNEDIFTSPIDIPTIKKIYQYCEEHDLRINLNSKYTRFINRHLTIPSPKETLITSLDTILSNPINQIVIQSTNYNRMLILKNLFLDKYPHLNNSNSSKSLNTQTPKRDELLYRDFINRNISKSSGVIRLLEHLNISPEEAISLGDGLNDLTMLEVTGLSIAMGNAVDELKNIADHIALTNNEDGVAHILKTIFEID